MAPKSPTKSQLYKEIADKTGLTKVQVGAVFDAFEEVARRQVRAKQAVALPGFLKIYAFHKKATAARMMRSPATGEMIQVSAKPARYIVKVKLLSRGKAMME